MAKPFHLDSRDRKTFAGIEAALVGEWAAPERVPTDAERRLGLADFDEIAKLSRALPHKPPSDTPPSPDLQQWQEDQEVQAAQQASEERNRPAIWVTACLGVVAAAAAAAVASTQHPAPPRQNIEAHRTVLESYEDLRRLGACAPLLLVVGDQVQQAKDINPDEVMRRPDPADFYATADHIADTGIPCTPETPEARAKVRIGKMTVTVTRASLLGMEALDQPCSGAASDWMQAYLDKLDDSGAGTTYRNQALELQTALGQQCGQSAPVASTEPQKP